MSINKQALVRYYALDRCFRNGGRKYFIPDLIEACEKALYDTTGNAEGVSRRQIFDDIKFMEHEGPWDLTLLRIREGRKMYYRYEDLNFSIKNTPLSEKEALLLKEALTTLSHFKGMPQLEWIDEMITRLESNYDLSKNEHTIIDFESNPFLKGLEHIASLYYAIREERPLTISYKSFKMEEPIQTIFHPHYLKQYNNRWFVFGVTDQIETFTNYALDRIVELMPCNNDYIFPQHDYHEIFEDAIGVSIPQGNKPEKILIKVHPSQWPYIENKPIHGSQKVINREDDGVTIQLELYLNYELEAQLLSLNSGITVLSPQRLRENIKKKLQAALANYSEEMTLV